MMLNLTKFKKKLSTSIPMALGELLLVIAGILIALSIDNWNDDRLERKKEIEYLTSIQEDIKINKTRLEKYQSEIEGKIRSGKIIESYTGTDTIYNTQYFNWHNMNVLLLSKFEPANNTYQEMKNSGNLTLIKNKEIKNALFELDALFENIKFAEEHIQDDKRVQLYDIIFNELLLKHLLTNYLDGIKTMDQHGSKIVSKEGIQYLINNVSYMNGVYLVHFNESFVINDINNIRKLNKAINSLIEAEIRK